MKSSKTGIITFNKAHNYGAVLQAYALKYKLTSLGFSVDFINSDNEIDRKNKLLPSYKKLGPKQFVRNLIRLILNLNRMTKRYIVFNDFIFKYLDSTNIKNSSMTYENVVLGSDQIWNPNITKGFDPIYFGIHPNLFCNNIISYAGSMGNGMLDVNFTPDFKDKLMRLNSIGTRENSLGEAIEKHFKLDTTINVDPTLLLKKEEWGKIVSDKYKNDKYILVYEVEHNKLTPKVSDLISKKLKLPIKVISSKISLRVPKDHITTASPEDFLSLFSNAEFIITSSFHGTVFSIINHKPFYTMKFNNGIDLRSEGLLSSVGLTSRHIDKLEAVDFTDIDYDQVDQMISTLRSKSESYLLNNLV
jgi:hypothetical protein